ncbi:ABC transporter substrate-binding protein [Paenibacillus eucommiae]|uniref:Iron complex transport system substrate-binding protein n=1 Tax=Paenibacillus eucommiae TaxID=1355755 RepID=A0ABS4J334_9BACL|nr:ABC transporter substrate-binding protein [Paenibacillus eucommiae]MBP1994238.1 iron complex transport system substrate-binding protein [Paenibacillus eucommiae]
MPRESNFTNHLSQELIEAAIQLWARSSIDIVDVRLQLLQPDKPLQPIRLPTSMFIYTQGGAASVTLNRTSFQTGRFGIFHGGKGTELSICPIDTDLETYMVLYKVGSTPFHKRNIHRLLEQINPFTQMYGLSPENPIFFMEKLKAMYDHWNSNVKLNQFYSKVVLYQTIHQIYMELRKGNIRYFEPDYVGMVKQYLDEHYSGQVSIQSLAELLPISRSLLTKLFKKREHKSVQEYLNEKRLEAAKKYLRTSHVTIQEIAAGCGFVDELNLNRMFKKYYRMTPRDYRRKMMDNFTNCDIDNLSQQPYNDKGLDRLAKSKGDGELSMFGQTRSKEFVLAAATSLMLLLSACASNAPVNHAGSPNPTPTQSQTQAASPADTKGTETAAQTRVIQTESGDMEVPADPQRIVYLVGNNVGDILPFGKTVVGVDIYGDPSKRPEEWKQQWGQHLDGVKLVAGNDLESILALDPDLIIGSRTWTSSSIEQLNKIAPTIFYNEMSALEERMTFFGEVFGMPEQAKEFIAQYENKAEAAKQRLVDSNLYDKKIVFLQGVEEGTPGLQGDKTRGIIYEDLGMRAPEMVEKEFFNSKNPKSEGFFSPLSMEVISEYLSEADMIAYTNFDPNVEELKKRLTETSIWIGLPAVKSGNVLFYSIDDTLNDYDYASRMVSLDTFVNAMMELPLAK